MPFVSLYPCFSVSGYQPIYMYQCINERHSKLLPAQDLRVSLVRDSALAGVESKAAIPTQRRGGGNVAPQWHKRVSGRTLASEPGRLSQFRETWTARANDEWETQGKTLN